MIRLRLNDKRSMTYEYIDLATEKVTRYRDITPCNCASPSASFELRGSGGGASRGKVERLEIERLHKRVRLSKTFDKKW